MKIKLWTINKWLRYTGFRLIIDMDENKGPDRKPTTLALTWVGLPGSRGWEKWEPK
jgi:hypothetical protein